MIAPALAYLLILFFTLERHGVEFFGSPGSTIKDGNIAVSTAARDGSDLWF